MLKTFALGGVSAIFAAGGLIIAGPEEDVRINVSRAGQDSVSLAVASNSQPILRQNLSCADIASATYNASGEALAESIFENAVSAFAQKVRSRARRDAFQVNLPYSTGPAIRQAQAMCGVNDRQIAFVYR